MRNDNSSLRVVRKILMFIAFMLFMYVIAVITCPGVDPIKAVAPVFKFFRDAVFRLLPIGYCR